MSEPPRRDRDDRRGGARVPGRAADADVRDDRPRRLAAPDAALVRRPRRRVLGVDVREVPEGPQPRARVALHGAGRGGRRVHRAARRDDEVRRARSTATRRSSRAWARSWARATAAAATRSTRAQAAKRVALQFIVNEPPPGTTASSAGADGARAARSRASAAAGARERAVRWRAGVARPLRARRPARGARRRCAPCAPACGWWRGHPALAVAQRVVEASRIALPVPATSARWNARSASTNSVPSSSAWCVDRGRAAAAAAPAALDRPLDRVALDHPARLDDLLGLLRPRPARRSRRAWDRAAEPLGLELPERGAHRRPAHAERLGDLALADQLAAGQRAVEDPFLDVQVCALARATSAPATEP